MAITPNIDLVKPAGTDHALVSVLNSNSDKIDSFAGTTNQAIATKANALGLGYNSTVVSCATTAAIETAVGTAVGAMSNNQTTILRVNVTATGQTLSGGSWNGLVYRGTASYYSALFIGYDNKVIYYTYRNGTAIWQELALKSGVSLGTNTSIPSTSIANGTFTTVATITNVPLGNYLLIVDMSFAAGSGNRILLVDTSETNDNTALNSVLAEGRATLQKIRPYRLNTTDTVYIRAYQNSGSSMNIGGNYRLVKISD